MYETVSNRELFESKDWKRLRNFLHIPVDAVVLAHLSDIEPNFPRMKRLKGMSKQTYLDVQDETRRLAKQFCVPSIWFEAAWSASKPKMKNHRS